MAISHELEAQILRYFHAEKWRVGTIARQLNIHHGVVTRVLAQAGLPRPMSEHRPSKVEPYLPLILETLAKYPRLTASRLYQMVRERGYTGGTDHFRHIIALHRPRPTAEAFLRLRTLPGEQAQVDWGHFGHLTIGQAKRPLIAFVMVLSYSRQVFLRFFLNAQMENFLRAHQAAFEFWGGIPRVLLYDNLKSAVLERQGDAIRFNSTFLEFAGYYRFEPRPVAVARGNEKGRVERSIRYVRDNFFAARSYVNLDDLNAQAETWYLGPSAERPCPGDRTRLVRQVFAEEQPRLLPLPANPFPTDEQVAVKAGKTPYVRFDLNDYSIPHDRVQRTLTVLATPTEVRIVEGASVLARHPRSYDKWAQIEDPAHIAALVAQKRAAHQHSANDRLAAAVPNSQELLVQAAQRGEPLGAMTAALLRLLDRYGATELQAAIAEALARGVPHLNAVRRTLERRRTERNQPPPLALNLSPAIQERDSPVRIPSLSAYDRLVTEESNHE